MTIRAVTPTAQRSVSELTPAQRLHFLVTNRIPRRWATLFIGWFSKIENPVISRLSIWVWQRFADDLRLEEAEKTSFKSMHDCFTRRLKAGARSFDPDPSVVASPCDAVVGAHGRIDEETVYQAKGYPYTLTELLSERGLIDRYRNGSYVTLRLKSSMYHRFHAPCDGRVEALTYVSGDAWNVDPITLRCIEKLFCRNERAVVEMRLDSGETLLLVPVAAVLVASMQFTFLDYPLDLRYAGPRRIACDARFQKGDEMGFFQHGSTILVFAPTGFQLCDDTREGEIIRAGKGLLQRTARLSTAV